jgi:hypothetical protein
LEVCRAERGSRILILDVLRDEKMIQIRNYFS